ncbi:hypothetical protein I552_2326 [Mycobacterium xenopi 3993]|nr:hypothetical protein I552_2326 [Mycobacterium xenopi 3993]
MRKLAALHRVDPHAYRSTSLAARYGVASRRTSPDGSRSTGSPTRRKTRRSNSASPG